MRKLLLLFYLLFINIYLGISQTAGDYRTKQAGIWGTAANWETWDGFSWVTATTAPNSTNNVITVDHAMTISATITLDQVVVSSTGSISVSGTPTITIADGTGVDLLNNGTINTANRPFVVNGQYTNNGTHSSTTGAITIAGTLTNSSTGTMNIGPITNNATITNNGTITTNGAVASSAAASNITNNGTWNVNSTFTINNATSSFTNSSTGNFSINSSGSLTLTNGTFTNNSSGTITNNGTITLNGGTFTTNGTVNNHNTFIHNLADANFVMTNPITNHVNSIFRYSRAGSQTVHEIPYWHLEIGGSLATNDKTLNLTNNYTISGNLLLMPVALNVVFKVNGAFNLNIFGTTTVSANAKLEPSANTVINCSNFMNLLNFGEIRVTNTSSTPLSAQYQSFIWTNVQDTGIVNYFASGTQIIEQTLPDGSSYGGLMISSPGMALNKTLTLTGNRTIRGNFIVNSTTAGGNLNLMGSGVISVGGRFDLTNNGLTHIEPTVTIQATGANSYINIGANTQIRITQTQFSSQFSNFLFVVCSPSSTQIYFSSNAQLVEALPTNGPLRPYGNLRLTSSRGANNVTFQATNIGIQGNLIDSTQHTTGNVIFTGSNIIFLNTGTITPRSIYKTKFHFHDLTASGSAEIRFTSTEVFVNGNLTVNSNTFISFDIQAIQSTTAITVLGTSTFEQNTTAYTSPKISFFGGTRAYIGNFNDVIINGNAQQIIFGGQPGNPTDRAIVNIKGNLTNNNTHSTTLASGNRVCLYFQSTTLKSIGGTNPVVVSDSIKMNGPWQLTNHLTLNAATNKAFILNHASLNLNTFNLVSTGTGAPHILEYLPTNVTMPPATHPFCSHAQVMNWNCVTAETIYVSTTGNNANNGLSWATAVRDMRVAVRKVAHGGVIMVANGTYTEIFDLRKKIKIHGQSNTNTIFQAPSGLTPPSPTCAISQQNDSAIVFFDWDSDSSYLYNVKITHNGSRIRRGVVIKSNVKGIVIENCNFEGTYDSFFGFPSLPSYVDCPGDNDNNRRTYNLFIGANVTFDVKNNNFTGYAYRTLGTHTSGETGSTSYIRNNTFNNTSPGGSGFEVIWLYDSSDILVQNNTVTGSILDYGVDVSNIKKYGSANGSIIVKDNTINLLNTNISQCVVKECTNEGKVTFQNNTITTRNASIGMKIETSQDVDVLTNVFNPVSQNFRHIVINNVSGSLISAVGANIYGNTFNSHTLYGGTAIQALREDPSTNYVKLNLNGASLGYPNNTFTTNTQYFLDVTQNLGTMVNSIDMTNGNAFPLGGDFDLFTVEERIVHRMDDARGASGTAYPRPMVFVVPNNYYVCNEYSTGYNTGSVIPMDNRSIQDAIDFADPHDTVNVQKGTFTYPSGTEFESIVNFNKPLSFRSNNNPLPSPGEPIIDRYVQVNLPSSIDSITQFNNFTFSDGFIENLTFQVNQGDWVLNGGVIRFANANATLVEALNNTIRGYTGWIQTTRNIGAPTNLNVAGFGAELTSTVNMGLTTIRRGHWEQTLPSPYRSIMRVFKISPTVNTGLNATFRFRYDPSELLGQNPLNLKQFRNANNFSPWHNSYNIVPYTLQGGTGSMSYFVDFSGINAFSSWTLGEATLLPVELLSFDATLVNQNSVRLDWNVANEINLSHYEIEKSYDLNTFNKIADNVQATGQSHYLSWDYQPKVGVNYYRLKMVDFDGSYQYSEIRTVVIDPTQELSLLVYPNPFNDNLQISLSGVENLPCDIYITDAIGKLVYTQHIKEWKGNTSVNLSSLSSGVYYLKLQAGDKTIGTKLVKN